MTRSQARWTFAVIASLLLAQPAHAAAATKHRAEPIRWYFSSAHGSYSDDWNGDRSALQEGRAPTGSGFTRAAPVAAGDSTAMSAARGFYAGSPTTGTFALPFTGPVSSVCVDVWAHAHYGDPRSPFLSLFLYIAPPHIAISDEAQGLGYILPTDHSSTGATAYPEDSVVHLTAVLHFRSGTAIPAGSSLMLGGLGNGVNQPDWTLVYGSRAHASSLTWNPTRCGTKRP